MYIVDYSTDYHNRNIQTTTFDGEGAISQIIGFIADKSVMKDFRVKSINNYENGKLHPHGVSLVHGRITIQAEAEAEAEAEALEKN